MRYMKLVRYKWYAHFEHEGQYYCDPLDAYKQEVWKAIKNLVSLREFIENGNYIRKPKGIKKILKVEEKNKRKEPLVTVPRVLAREQMQMEFNER